MTITHDALYLTVQGPPTWDLTVRDSPIPCPASLFDMGPHCTGTPTSSGDN